MELKPFIIELLGEFDKGKYSNIILSDRLNSRPLKRAEKGFVTEVYYGVIRNRILLDYFIEKNTKKIKKRDLFLILEISIYQIIYMNSDNKGVIWEAAEYAKKKYGSEVAGFINATLRKITEIFAGDMEKLKSEGKWDILLSYPRWFYDRVLTEYGDETISLLESYKKPGVLSVRVNTLKYSPRKFENYLHEKGIGIIAKYDNIYYLDSGEIINSELMNKGHIFPQDASSYLSAWVLAPKSGEKVLDCCSAPGGKTLAMADMMFNSGEITAVDIHEHRLKLIDDNCKKAGVSIVKTLAYDATKLYEYQGAEFDKILADVPCSGFGTLRKKPEIVYQKNTESITGLAKLQFDILKSVSQLLKAGGEMVYSTCTIFREENTDVVKRFLGENSNFSILEINLPYNLSTRKDEIGGVYIDHKNRDFDGFYIIKLKREK